MKPLFMQASNQAMNQHKPPLTIKQNPKMRIPLSMVLEKFLRYAKVDTQSDPLSATCPSTPTQKLFAQQLAEELRTMGASDISLDENGYLMATLPATTKQQTPVIGLIAHIDTSPDMSGTGVRPKIIAPYNGADIVLNHEKNIVLRTDTYPEIKRYIGQTLITTDGTTLLGADDKAGVAAIMSAAEYLLTHTSLPHGRIRIAFTPDEEIGRGADRFDIARFAADYAYTFDGGELGELEYENFNAAEAVVTIEGNNVHPGYGKNKMRNALNLAHAFHAALPADERPETTDGRDGFFHLNTLKGTEEKAVLYYIIRDFDRRHFEERKQQLQKAADAINIRYAQPVVSLQLQDQYYNMHAQLLPHLHIVARAEEAMRRVGIDPIITAARGGTDGARLSYMGLPCPNIFAGGHNPHGKYEFLPAESMQKAAELILEIVKS
jgi:tripeptide aminopeptidase